MAGARRVSRIARTVGVAGVLGALVVFVSMAALASKVDPVPKDGNPTCGDFNSSWTQLKVEPVANGTFTDGTLSVTISNFDGHTLDWSSNIGVSSVFVKGGPNGNLYTYDPPVTSDTGLHPQVNPNNGQYYGFSHVSFCYVAPETTPTPTPSQTASETPSPTPTQTVSESPTPMPTETETRTPGPSVGATETQKSPTTKVLGEKFGHTGADVLRWIFIGVGMVLFGIAAYVISMRGARENR